MMKWNDNCVSNGGLITLSNVMVYGNYAPGILTPVGGTACVTTRIGSLNHFEIQVSRQHLDIYGSDYSPDNGQSFPNFRNTCTPNSDANARFDELKRGDLVKLGNIERRGDGLRVGKETRVERE